MPYITVKLPKEEYKIDIVKLAKDISEKADLEMNRINLILEYFNKDTFYKGIGNDFPAVHIEAGSRNGKEFIQNLMKVTVQLVEEQLNLEKNCITGYSHPIEEGYLFLRGTLV